MEKGRGGGREMKCCVRRVNLILSFLKGEGGWRKGGGGGGGRDEVLCQESEPQPAFSQGGEGMEKGRERERGGGRERERERLKLTLTHGLLSRPPTHSQPEMKNKGKKRRKKKKMKERERERNAHDMCTVQDRAVCLFSD